MCILIVMVMLILVLAGRSSELASKRSKKASIKLNTMETIHV